MNVGALGKFFSFGSQYHGWWAMAMATAALLLASTTLSGRNAERYISTKMSRALGNCGLSKFADLRTPFFTLTIQKPGRELCVDIGTGTAL
ncbi:hypothetical protein LZ31DRAFT_552047 [Colletotrichum somersetense]|nr:hypothetical protein LZ31DRAFT_552047 [Colletotrichum somersetense]